jgi:DNA integrity scanning protein DisA with diadenylate cyclase activity
MQTASFNGFLKMLLYFVAFYYVFKFLARIFLPIILKKAVEKAGQNFQQQSNSNTQYHSNKDEIIIDTSQAKKSKETKKVGDYVDFEEIE